MNRARRASVCAAILLAWLAGGVEARAQGSDSDEHLVDAAEQSADAPSSAVMPQVALEVSPADSPVVPLLRAEIRELGLVLVDASEPGVPSITMRVALTKQSLEVRITDNATGQVTAREEFSVADRRAMEPRTAVIHAVELLRSHLRFRGLKVGASAPAEPSEPIASRAPPPKPERAAELTLALLPMVDYSPGGTRLGLGGEIDVLRRWGALGVRLFGASSFAPNRVSVPEGFIEVTAGWGGLQGVVILDGSSSGTSVELGAGAALFASTLRGTATAADLGRDEHVLTLAPLGDLRVRQRITPGFALVLGSVCLVPLQSSRLRVLGRAVGRYGQAVITLGLGVELTIF